MSSDDIGAAARSGRAEVRSQRAAAKVQSPKSRVQSPRGRDVERSPGFGLWTLDSGLSSPSPPAPGLEEGLEGLGEGLGGTEAQRINAGTAEGAAKFGKALRVDIGKFLAHGGAAGINLKQLPRLGVLDGQQPGGGQRAFTRVMEMHAHQVVADVGEAEFLEGAAAWAGLGEGGAEAVQEIGEQEYDRAPVQHAIQEAKGRRDVRAAVLGLEEEHLTDQPQNMAPPFARRQDQLDLIGEQQQRHL